MLYFFSFFFFYLRILGKQTGNKERNKRILTDLGGEIFEDGGEVDRGTSTDSLGVLACFEEPGDTANGELETGFAAARCALLGGA